MVLCTKTLVVVVALSKDGGGADDDDDDAANDEATDAAAPPEGEEAQRGRTAVAGCGNDAVVIRDVSSEAEETETAVALFTDAPAGDDNGES